MKIDKKQLNEVLKGYNDLKSTFQTLNETYTCYLSDVGKLEGLKNTLRDLFKFKGGGYYEMATLSPEKISDKISEKQLNKILDGFNTLNSVINSFLEINDCSMEELGNLDRFQYTLQEFFKFKDDELYYKDSTLSPESLLGEFGDINE